VIASALGVACRSASFFVPAIFFERRKAEVQVEKHGHPKIHLLKE
jgi:hypothetical protein